MTTPATDTAADLETARKNLQAAQTAHDKAEAEGAGPRKADVILMDWFEAVTMRLGNRPELRKLLDELKAATEQPPPEPGRTVPLD